MRIIARISAACSLRVPAPPPSRPAFRPGKTPSPIAVFGIRVLSIGFFVLSTIVVAPRNAFPGENAPPWFLPTEIASLENRLETPMALDSRGLTLETVLRRLGKKAGLDFFLVSPQNGHPAASAFSRTLRRDLPKRPLRDHLYSLCRKHALSAGWVLEEGRIRGIRFRPFGSASEN